MKVITRVRALHPRNVFRISRATRRETLSVFVQVEREGVKGVGEAPANAYYGEDAGDIAARLEGAAGWLDGKRVECVGDIERVWEEAWALLAPSRAAQCALDVALWDWLGKHNGVSVAELALGREAAAVPTFTTIGISDPEELESNIAELRGFPRVKVKADGTGDVATMRAVRAAMPKAMMAVDANCAWGNVDAETAGRELAGMAVEFIEQPLPPGRDEEMAHFCEQAGLLAMADESCVTREDVERVGGNFGGFNIKLVKCGGLTPALSMARRGPELGLKTMVGCMLESSVLIAAGAVVAQLTNYADLDGAWLLGDDPAEGWVFEKGVLTLGTGSGLGAVVRDG